MNYSGIKVVRLHDDELELFYSQPELNFQGAWRVEENQYVIIEDERGAECGLYKRKDDRFEPVPFYEFESRRFGTIKPKKGDFYQIAYMDSLVTNQLTFCTGPAGSGKTQLALGYAFQEFERGNFSKIVIFVNPHIALGAVKMGFLPGTKVDKLLESSIGSILISKIGSRTDVEALIEREEIVLMPMGDARGYEVPDDSFVYFTEAQNTSRYLMKLFLQRTNDNCKICVEGDTRQVDSESFENGLNGLTRGIEVFKGEPYAGHVQLRNIYRGRIAKKAEEICD